MSVSAVSGNDNEGAPRNMDVSSSQTGPLLGTLVNSGKLSLLTVVLLLFNAIYLLPPFNSVQFIELDLDMMNRDFDVFRIINSLNTILFSPIATLVIISSLLLGLVYLYDLKVLQTLKFSRKIGSLDQERIHDLNHVLGLETEIVHEDEPCDKWSIYQSDIPADLMERVKAQFMRFQADFEVNQEGIPRKCEDYLEVRSLPNLPQVFDRDQVGLFATQPIPQWTLFYWVGDLGVARSSDHATLPRVARMNRRTLMSFEGVDIFQGGSQTQRSGCGVLANYFWCHTQSTPAVQSVYRLLPFNFLGQPNCVYVTTKKDQRLCSALLSFAEVKKGDQILMYTGSEEQSRLIDRRLRAYRVTPFIASFGLICSLIKVYGLFKVYCL